MCPPKIVSTTVGDRARSCGLFVGHVWPANLDSVGIGWRGSEHPTRAIFPPGPPPSQDCACLLIRWMRGDVRDTNASTILFHDGVTG